MENNILKKIEKLGKKNPPLKENLSHNNKELEKIITNRKF